MRIAQIPVQVAESAMSIFGIRVGTEEPHYLATPVGDGVELRQYGPRIAAETTVAADEDRARSICFRRLASYIFGANHRDEKIAMTAPVAQQGGRNGDEIAMTAPVAQSRQSDDRLTIRFFMPSKWSLDTLPKPDSDDVTLVTVPGETVAVLRFSGDRSAAAVSAKTNELLEILRDKRIDVVGEPVAWFYDPPWTVPFLRRNEIAVPVAG
ncbi:heme-binding protein [Mycobacterium sp. ITM-2016-00318]|uniref:SOUL family heme-binding protein n=1 Tax=Mycobacterium sp. ITM-2016-00318 TaxID=2099693 RepID=UPI000CFA1708|nr:heme-binding protein [Mycobacterium sp. ITM-2016-00318]WNG93519.1 heme-binding protein [Mycobacterium sp. ITM-2016-00318]